MGVGAAIGFSRMMVTLLDEGKIDLSDFKEAVDVGVLVMSDECVGLAMKVIAELRDNSIVAVPFLDIDKKFRVQMEFANKINCKFSIIIGEDEVKNNFLTLRNMKTGEQGKITLDDAVKLLIKTK